MLYRAVEFGSPDMEQIKERYLRYSDDFSTRNGRKIKKAMKKYAYDMVTLFRSNVKIILSWQFM